MKTIRQHDESDCGAACLAAIAAHYGKPLSIAHIRLLAGTDSTGSTLNGLREAALRIGFQAEAVQGDYAGIQKATLPAIVHLSHSDTGDHFVVLAQAGKRHSTVLDPADGRRHRWPAATFSSYWSGAALLLLPGAEFYGHASHTASFWLRCWRLLRPLKAQLGHTLLLAIAATLLAMGGALFVKWFTDDIIPHGYKAALHYTGLLFMLVIVLQAAASTGRRLLTLRTARAIDTCLLTIYCGHLLRLPRIFFNQMQTGELLSRMGDAVKIRQFINDMLLQLGVPVGLLIAIMLLWSVRQPQLGLLLLAMLILHVAVYTFGHTAHRRLQRKLMEADAALDSQFTETFQAVATVKQLGLGKLHAHKLEARIHDLLHAAHASGRMSSWVDEATSLLAQGLSLAILWAGGLAVLQGPLSLGELLAFYTLSGYFSGAAAQLMPITKHLQEAQVAAGRLYAILELPPDTMAGATLLYPDTILPVRMEAVCFGYHRKAAVLQDLSVAFHRGEITIIQGSSGSGKSTLLSLLLQQYPLSDGRISFGIHPAALIHPEALHRLVAVVPQHTQLFNDTLAANVCAGLQRDTALLEGLCNELGLLPCIASWPMGFDTPLGPDGCLLSGGQRQLVALARALYRQPQLLLLDEATASLDDQAEALVHSALLRRKTQGMAIVLVSHRRSSRILADRLLQLHMGRLTAIPTDRLPYPQHPPRIAAQVVPANDHALPPGNSMEAPDA
ncbi:peptidase domain-containing ABC transporter [Parapedobacter sp. ISTM3]|uniref:peptidase domain-containing ABC transporter n=1 Tax=Parapedobacter sp. ISTM3 TaxID=2800130 RepID=UPI00190626D6|nr:peptidase domain-containing ABC transporter [Parapedobacter sp. ISTM3]MBK1442584.1 peptidase domain-containing ABC transporter [Parapedobacter sp. ISTM3]